MDLVEKEVMTVKCNHCNAVSQTSDMSDFKESGTYPPMAHFLCPACSQMATIHADMMPKRLFSSLLVTVAKERGIFSDQQAFNNLRSIAE